MIKIIAKLSIAISILCLSIAYSQAKSSGWMSYSELKRFAAELRSNNRSMDRLECSADMKSGKRYFKVRHKNNRSKREWKWAVARSVLNLNQKYSAKGYRQVSLSTVIRKIGKFQCGVWVK
jgi:hypothetical protein